MNIYILKEKDIEKFLPKNLTYELLSILLLAPHIYQTPRTILPLLLLNSFNYLNSPMLRRTYLKRIPAASKCHRFNASHGSNSSSCSGFPSSSGYKTITKHTDVIGQPAVLPSTSSSSKSKTVALLVEVIDSDKDEIVAAFAPSAVLGDGTDSGGSDNVSTIAPLKCKHFIWQCLIDGPSTEFPVKVSSLVDNSCHLVLIHPNIVHTLGLNIFTLKEPEPIDVAIKNSKQKKKLELKEFVLLSAMSLDQSWTSQ